MFDTSGNAVVNLAAGALVTAASGIVGYSFAANDVATSGQYFGKFNITVGGVDYVIPNGGSQNLVINITVAPPVIEPLFITSPLTAIGTHSVVFTTYTIAATNSPTSYNASGLPVGLSVNTSNGQITGTPTTAGVYNSTISATNADGTATAMLVITIA
jgi:hypothetical protein